MKLSAKEQQRLRSNYGDWAIVTGASSGIGLEIASHLADAGFHLLIVARNKDRLRDAEQRLRRNPIQIRPLIADLSESEGVAKVIRAASGLNIGLLVNNAGYGTSGLFVDSELAAEINMLRVNCEAVLALTHYFSQQFRQQKRGGIVFLSSLVAFQGVPFAAHYAATKAYIQSFAEALAVEMKPFGVSVIAAAPGPVASGFGQRAGMNMPNAISPEGLGAPILAALGRQTNVVPGRRSKILVYSLRTLPRFFKIRILRQVMKGFTGYRQ